MRGQLRRRAPFAVMAAIGLIATGAIAVPAHAGTNGQGGQGGRGGHGSAEATALRVARQTLPPGTDGHPPAPAPRAGRPRRTRTSSW
ncbi:hypothetical protein [Parafrankia sp. EUN1f]|uniref:hypothetical protein n=1 Tax=Parafrankia sp. EUN1f TaxID=102897 RepID=UPI0001C463D8|nr:hypothetical protein [Parafrankia sp. EUN1f]EFC81167.1 hypothetical protein FrEUN1fDRAFT_5696 [Parafrankia sp. EUN1f]